MVSGAAAELAASASDTNPPAPSAAADSAGGGNAPAAAGGGGAVAASVVGRVAVILALANQPSAAGALSLATTSEKYVGTMFESIDVSFLLLAFCVWALVSCMCMIGIAFFFGRASVQSSVQQLATSESTGTHKNAAHTWRFHPKC